MSGSCMGSAARVGQIRPKCWSCFGRLLRATELPTTTAIDTAFATEAFVAQEHPRGAAMAAAGGLSALSRFKRPRRAMGAATVGQPATMPSTSLDALDCEHASAEGTDAEDDLADWLALADASKDALTLSQFWIDKMRLVSSADRGKRVVTVSAIRVAVLSQV